MNLAPPLAAALAAALVPAATADVWNVRGPSPDFQQIDAAVAAAQDGDVIRVWPGSDYDRFTIDGKSLTITAHQGVRSVRVDGTVTVRNLAAGQVVHLDAIDAQAEDGKPSSDQFALVIADNDGRVVVGRAAYHGHDATSGIGAPVGYEAVLVKDSADVVLRECSAFGGEGMPFFDYSYGGSALLVNTSHVRLLLGTYEGGDGGDAEAPSDDDGGDGGYGISANDSTIHLDAVTLIGGDGGVGGGEDGPFGDFGEHGDAGACMHLTNANGTAYVRDTFCQVGTGPNGPGGELTGSGTYHLLPGEAHTLSLVSGGPVRTDGSFLTFHFTGDPGEAVWLSVELVSSSYPLPGVAGADPLLLYAGNLKENGQLNRGWRLPQLPDLGWRTWIVTPHYDDGTSTHTAAPMVLTDLDAAW